MEQIICVLCNASGEPKTAFRRPEARFGSVTPSALMQQVGDDGGDIAHGPERLEKAPIRMLSLIYGNDDD